MMFTPLHGYPSTGLVVRATLPAIAFLDRVTGRELVRNAAVAADRLLAPDRIQA